MSKFSLVHSKPAYERKSIKLFSSHTLAPLYKDRKDALNSPRQCQCVNALKIILRKLSTVQSDGIPFRWLAATAGVC